MVQENVTDSEIIVVATNKQLAVARMDGFLLNIKAYFGRIFTRILF